MVKQKKYFADIAIPPGKTINDLLLANNMTQAELAIRMDMSKKHINQIIKGKTALTPETALKLEKIFEPPASFWLNLENNYQEARARIEYKEEEKEKQIAADIPYYEMVKLGWIEKAANLEEKINNLRFFFRVSNLCVINKAYEAAYRSSKPEKVSSIALAAWLGRGEYLARDKDVNKFSKKKLKDSIHYIRTFTLMEPDTFFVLLKEKLSECGIKFVMVPYLSGTYAQGATKWLAPDKAIIQMSLRYKYADIFWFSFFHEIGHLLLHGKKETYIEYELDKREDFEKEADAYAAEVLIPSKEYKKFVKKHDFSKQNIVDFANRIEIDPGIIVGRLQFEELIGYEKYSGLRKKYYWGQFNG